MDLVIQQKQHITVPFCLSNLLLLVSLHTLTFALHISRIK